MKLLLISDKKPENLKNILESEKLDLIITLWDLEESDIRELAQSNVPKIWVYGNHDTAWYMQNLWIKNMHLQTFTLNWITFGGFEGCVRYKPWNHIMYTQEEASEMIKKLPKVDVLLCHCPPLWINDNTDPSHIWFEALRWYVDTFSPKALFHWHTYRDENFVENYKNTKVHYIEWAKIF